MMTRDAKVYTLMYKDWKPLVEEIESNELLKNEVAVFQLSHANSGEHIQGYVIISISDNADEVVEKYGGEHEETSNLYFSMKKYTGEPLYGNRSILEFLMKK